MVAMLLARVDAGTTECILKILEGVIVLARRRRIPQQRLDRRCGCLVRCGEVLCAVRIVMTSGGSLFRGGIAQLLVMVGVMVVLLNGMLLLLLLLKGALVALTALLLLLLFCASVGRVCRHHVCWLPVRHDWGLG